MTKYARVDGGTVAEVIETDGDINKLFHPSIAAALVACGLDVQPGWVQVGGGFQAPTPKAAPSVPGSVSPRQARLALLARGLLDQANAVINAAPEAVQIAWQFADSIDRSSPLVSSIATAMGLQDSQIDDLFSLAITL